MIPRNSAESPGQVLIVDESDESREVLRIVLERRGMRILEASGARQGLDLVRRFQPDVIVLDLELGAETEQTVRQEYGAASAARDGALVMLSSSPRRGLGEGGPRMVSKPYHYAPLVRTIEELLQRSIASHLPQRMAAGDGQTIA